MKWFVEMIKREESPSSTIVYVPTIAKAETISSELALAFGKTNVRVAFYHGQMAGPDRTRVYESFINDAVQVIVATVAFGMGIDKANVRRIIHVGPPKTLEDYYQQIGRAGRDGLDSTCYLVYNDADFTRYSSEYFLGELHGNQRDALVASNKGLRDYVENNITCRRVMMLSWFQELAEFERCNNCDNCAQARSGITRDFAAEMGQLLRAISTQATKAKAMSVLSLNPLLAEELFRIASNQRWFTRESKVKATVKTTVNYDLLRLTLNGAKMLNACLAKVPLVLAVPETVLEQERDEHASQERRLKQLVDELAVAAVAIDEIPEHERLRPGPVVRAHKNWHFFLQK